jgi:hypothetical protein
LQECRSFWITEVGVATGGVSYRRSSYITWEVGHMVNVSPRLALGGTLVTAYNMDHAGVGAKVRARWWLGPKLSVELSPGAILWDPHWGAKTPRLAAHIGLNYADWIALTGQVEATGGREPGQYVGLKGGSYAGVTGFAVTAALVAIAIVGAGTAP